LSSPLTQEFSPGRLLVINTTIKNTSSSIPAPLSGTAFNHAKNGTRYHSGSIPGGVSARSTTRILHGILLTIAVPSTIPSIIVWWIPTRYLNRP